MRVPSRRRGRPPRAHIPLPPVVDAFLDERRASRDASLHTIAAYRADLQDAADWLARRQTALCAADGFLLRDYLASRTQDQPRTLLRRRASLRQFFRFLRSEGQRTDDPTATLVAARRRVDLPDVLSVAETEKLLAAIDADGGRALRLRLILELLYGGGLRISEAVGLPLAAVQLAEGFVRIRGKGGRERLAPLSPVATDLLRRWLAQRGKTGGPFLFPSRGRMGHLTRQRFFQLLKETARRAGLDPARVHPHSLRHAFATHLLAGGADLRSVQTLLGHADIATTEIYTHLARTQVRAAVLRGHPLARKKNPC